MKHYLTALVLIVSAVVFAAEQQGPMANVELLSGTKQRAQFIGIENDTVQLGGYIQNKFTVVRIAKSQFKSIVDDNGKDLLSDTAAVKASADTSAADTLAAATIDSTADSATVATVDSTNAIESPTISETNYASSTFIAYESPDLDSSLARQIFSATSQLITESGDSVQNVSKNEFPECNDDLCIQQALRSKGVKTIYFEKTSRESSGDSLGIELTQILYEEDLPTIHKARIKVSAKSPLSDAFSLNRLTNLVLQAKGVVLETKKSKKSFVFIETDPEGATITRPDVNAICKSPCTFAVSDTNRVEFYAYWNVDAHMWGGQASVLPIPGDTAKISMKLKRIMPEVHIITNPINAEIFKSNEPISKKSKALGTTPSKFNVFEPGMASVILRKQGYRDSLVTFFIAPTAETTISVDLQSLTSPEAIKAQDEWIHDRRMLHVGHMLMGLSIAPVAVGALFAYLGSKDYDDADDIKKELSMPGDTNGANYQKKVKKNKDLADKGDKKMIIGGSLVGTGLVLFGLGLFFTF